MSTPTGTDRWAALDFGPPAPDVEETEPPVLLDYLVRRPHRRRSP